MRVEFLRGTRQPFRRWRLETARLRLQADLFCGTFWPLYVWRRWTNHRVSSVDKVFIGKGIAKQPPDRDVSSRREVDFT